MEMLSQKACNLPKIVVFECIDIDLKFQNERKIERRSKRLERERERKVVKIWAGAQAQLFWLSVSASAADFSERTKALPNCKYNNKSKYRYFITKPSMPSMKKCKQERIIYNQAYYTIE